MQIRFDKIMKTKNETTEQKQFDLVLVDIQVPKVNGIETVKRIRAKERATGERVAIIALTAYALQG